MTIKSTAAEVIADGPYGNASLGALGVTEAAAIEAIPGMNPFLGAERCVITQSDQVARTSVKLDNMGLGLACVNDLANEGNGTGSIIPYILSMRQALRECEVDLFSRSDRWAGGYLPRTPN